MVNFKNELRSFPSKGIHLGLERFALPILTHKSIIIKRLSIAKSEHPLNAIDLTNKIEITSESIILQKLLNCSRKTEGGPRPQKVYWQEVILLADTEGTAAEDKGGSAVVHKGRTAV